jgi:hypothetical protein
LEELKDYRNMVESIIRTNDIVSFKFMDELKYWNIEKEMVDLKGQTKWQQQWQNKLLIRVNLSLTSKESP